MASFVVIVSFVVGGTFALYSPVLRKADRSTVVCAGAVSSTRRNSETDGVFCMETRSMALPIEMTSPSLSFDRVCIP
jgi:hypothetical protein